MHPGDWKGNNPDTSGERPGDSVWTTDPALWGVRRVECVLAAAWSPCRPSLKTGCDIEVDGRRKRTEGAGSTGALGSNWSGT